jgi:hypothetical protein
LLDPLIKPCFDGLVKYAINFVYKCCRRFVGEVFGLESLVVVQPFYCGIKNIFIKGRCFFVGQMDVAMVVAIQFINGCMQPPVVGFGVQKKKAAGSVLRAPTGMLYFSMK